MERCFTAGSLEDAFAQVKRDLGADAIVVSSRTLVGGDGGRGSTRVEVTALSCQDAARAGFDTRSRRPPAHAWLEKLLLSSGVHATMVKSLVARVAEAHRGASSDSMDAEQALSRALSEELVFAGDSHRRAPRVVAFVGPTGAGKTTTIAKLAAIGALVEKKRVALISIDNYRVGGVAHLESYADLIGIPLDVASDARTLERALTRFESAELVLIDTTGRSPRSRTGVEETAATLRGASEPVEIHLCMALGQRDAEVNAVIDRYATLEPTRLVLTKLDEAVDYGPIVFAQARSGLPLSYFCTGQRVPEDVEIASAARVASLLCGKDIAA